METIEQVKNSEEIVKDPIINEGEKAFLFWKGKRYQGALGHEVLRIYLVKEGTIKTSSRSKKESVVTGTLFKKCIDIYSTLRQYGDDKKLLPDEEIFKRPRWVRVVHNYSKDFTPLTSESNLFVGKGTEISPELLEKVDEVIEKHFDNALGLRTALCDLFIDNGITIDIDPIVEK